MRFFLDQDVYAVTARFLTGAGHDVVTAADAGLSRAPIRKSFARLVEASVS